MSLLSLDQCRSTVNTGVSDVDLQAIIDREEADLVDRLGDAGDGATARSETVAIASGSSNVYLSRRIASVTSVEEAPPGGSYSTVATTGYEVWARQGRVERVSGSWAGRVRVTYVPTDERPRWRRALIELVRIALERTAMKEESVAKEFSYTAPADWELERDTIYRTLVLPRI
jgi:hypothetical protein